MNPPELRRDTATRTAGSFRSGAPAGIPRARAMTRPAKSGCQEVKL